MVSTTDNMTKYRSTPKAQIKLMSLNSSMGDCDISLVITPIKGPRRKIT